MPNKSSSDSVTPVGLPANRGHPRAGPIFYRAGSIEQALMAMSMQINKRLRKGGSHQEMVSSRMAPAILATSRNYETSVGLIFKLQARFSAVSGSNGNRANFRNRLRLFFVLKDVSAALLIGYRIDERVGWV